MLEKGYTMPILFGICLGLILAGVQISATALNSVLGHQDIALVAFENAENGVDMRVLGKRVSLHVPGGPDQMVGTAVERAGSLYGRCRDKAGLVCGELAALAELGRDRARDLYRRWKDRFHRGAPGWLTR